MTTSPAKQAGMKYIVVENVTVVNHGQAIVSYRLKDFSLVVGKKRYHPSARPGLGAIDISSGGVAGPHQAVKGNLAFLVPAAVNAGSIEFKPSNWLVNGTPLILCCAADCHR